MNPGISVAIHCIEQDGRAIAYASDLCHDHLSKIVFQQANALKFVVDKKFDLVWSAGLFDYLSDEKFLWLVKKLESLLTPSGTMVIGNFADTNPSRPYMELFDWRLYHRSQADLLRIAGQAGYQPQQVWIDTEPEKVNLFLHLVPRAVE